MKAGIITEQLSDNKETDSDNDKRDLGMHDVEIVQLVRKTLKMKNLMDLWKINSP